jgi:conjugal transfer ATP-binding protein TraC
MVLVDEILELRLDQNTPSSKHINKKYDQNRLISDQILSAGFKHEVCEDRIKHHTSKLTSKCYFVSELPKEFSLNSMIGLLGDSTRSHLSIPGRFILSYTIATNLNKSTQNALIGYGEKIIDSSEKWYTRNDRNIGREAAEWRDINDRAKNGEKFLTEYFQVMLTTQEDFIDEAEQSLFSLYNILNWRLEINRYFQFPALLSILPMQIPMLWGHLSKFKLTRTALSSEVIAKLPIHAEWKGVPEPGMLLMGRRGQLFHFNPFYRISSGNYNICVFGPSGSGKSVFLQELATSLMAQDAKIFILDIGLSFKNICVLLGGELIQFGKDSNIVLNPFAGFKQNMLDEDRTIAISYAKAIICSMCGAKGDNLKESIVEKAIKLGLDSYGENFNITLLSEMLTTMGESEKGNNQVANDLSHSLFSYSEQGIFGKFFGNNSKDNKRKETKFDKQITVFEFEEIRNNTSLLAVVLQIISMQIFMQVLTGDRSKRFVLIVDEAWMILDYAAKFLAELARTIRKYGGSLVVCVQNYSDLQGSEHHKAVLQNSTWTVLLKQDEKGINAFKESEAFKDMIPLIKSISIAKDKYAEMLLYATGVQVVGRLMLESYSKILYSTDREIFNELNKMTDSGMLLEEAVEIIAKRKYGND